MSVKNVRIIACIVLMKISVSKPQLGAIFKIVNQELYDNVPVIVRPVKNKGRNVRLAKNILYCKVLTVYLKKRYFTR